jgi:hypothetical protein
MIIQMDLWFSTCLQDIKNFITQMFKITFLNELLEKINTKSIVKNG